MNALARSPFRNLVSILAFVAVVIVIATAAYMAAGWSFGDAIYMVLLTVYTVGYEEVRPVNTPYLHAVTIGTIVLGCTGMILVTGALVQALTASQIQQLLGGNRVKTDIDKLKGHTIVCGFGRIGVMLARDLASGGAAFVILDTDEAKLAHARDLGYLAWGGDATDEAALKAVGVERARTLASVLPNDAANVFITLSAKALNPKIQVIARAEAPSTETKLIQAGADKVVMPTHIGAERIAEMILFPQTAQFIRDSERMRDFEKVLGDLGLALDVAVAGEGTAVEGMTVEALEAKGQGAFFVVQINRKDGQVVTRPGGERVIEAGDGLVVVSRSGDRLNRIFTAPKARPRAGRTTF